jgi:hypothetical protein
MVDSSADLTILTTALDADRSPPLILRVVPQLSKGVHSPAEGRAGSSLDGAGVVVSGPYLGELPEAPHPRRCQASDVDRISGTVAQFPLEQ